MSVVAHLIRSEFTDWLQQQVLHPLDHPARDALSEPLLKLAGAIEASHISVVAALTLFLNRRDLPPGLRPSWLTAGVTLLAALSFAAFAALYVVRLVLPN